MFKTEAFSNWTFFFFAIPVYTLYLKVKFIEKKLLTTFKIWQGSIYIYSCCNNQTFFWKKNLTTGFLKFSNYSSSWLAQRMLSNFDLIQAYVAESRVNYEWNKSNANQISSFIKVRVHKVIFLHLKCSKRIHDLKWISIWLPYHV